MGKQYGGRVLGRCLAVAGSVLLAVFCLDAAIFRSGLYQRVVSPDSSAGSVQYMIRMERERPLRFERRVLVLGNSQQAEGFSAKIARKVLTPELIDIVNAGVPGVTMRDWFYMVRDLDPEATRYNVIAIPFPDYSDLDYDEAMASRIQDLNMVVGSLQLRDLVSFSFSFPDNKDKWSAFRGALLKGLTYREDIRDFLHAPRQRLAATADYRKHGTEWQDDYSGNEKSLTGLTYDPAKRTVHFASGTSGEIEQLVRSRLNLSGVAVRGDQRAFAKRWLTALEERYRDKDVRFVVFRMPQYPVHLILPESDAPSVVDGLRKDPRHIVLAEDEFDWLEKPEFALDGLHLNARGRVEFSTAFGKKISEVLAAFQPKSK